MKFPVTQPLRRNGKKYRPPGAEIELDLEKDAGDIEHLVHKGVIKDVRDQSDAGAEEKARQEAEAKAKADAEAKQKAEQEAAAKAEADGRADGTTTGPDARVARAARSTAAQ